MPGQDPLQETLQLGVRDPHTGELKDLRTVLEQSKSRNRVDVRGHVFNMGEFCGFQCGQDDRGAFMISFSYRMPPDATVEDQLAYIGELHHQVLESKRIAREQRTREAVEDARKFFETGPSDAAPALSSGAGPSNGAAD